MAKLQTHSNFESVINPDDQKLSADYNKNRVQEISELASARINQISTGRGRGGEGLEGYFENFEDGTLINPRGLSRQVRNRVMDIIRLVGEDAEITNNGSSASTLDTGLWNYTRTAVLGNIADTRSNCLKSLTVLQGYKEAMEKAQAGAFEQFQNMKSRQEEVIENRSWWQKTGRRVLKVATLGTYALVERKKRQKFFNNRFEKQMKNRFDELNRNIAKLEKEATSRKDRMKSHMKRVLASAHDPARKALLKKELITAVQNTSGNLAGFDLPNWTNYAGGTGINDEQEKIDFLEAAKDLDFVKNDLAAIGISKAKNAQQSEMINSAKLQQEIFDKSNNFKFEKVQEQKGFKGLDTAGIESPKVSKLVHNIERDLRSFGFIDLENDIYRGDIKKEELLTDSVRLVLLIKKIRGIAADKYLQVSTRKEILKWIEENDKESGGEESIHKRKKVKEQSDILKDNSTGDGVLKDSADKLNKAKSLDITNSRATFNTFKAGIDTWAADIQTKYAEFLAKEGTKYFPKKDFKLLKESWDKVMKSREFLLTQADKWVEEKKQYLKEKSKISSGATSKLSLLNVKIDELENPTTGKIKKSLDGYNTLTTATVTNKYEQADKKVRLEQALNFINGYKSELKVLETERKELKNSIDLPELSNFAEIQKHLDTISLESGIDYYSKITAKKNPAIGTLDERIRQKLRAETFPKEINDKFIENLAKNDQYETLKNVSEGTSVKLTYKVVGGSEHVDFPTDLDTAPPEDFIVYKQDKEKGVIHLKNGSHFISISNVAAKGKDVYKNAVVRKNTGGTRGVLDPMVGGAADHAIVYNMKIAA